MTMTAKKVLLDQVLDALVEERHRMTGNDLYSLGNVYGMNNAIDLIAKMAKVDPLTLLAAKEPRYG